MNILLGLTGSVASTLYIKLIDKLSELGNVDVILTDKAKTFIDAMEISESKVRNIYTDDHEWYIENKEGILHKWKKNDPILHIELRKQAGILVIAPCSANTLAKLANGISDNLLTCVARAWDFNRPIIIAPAMNTYMWEHPITEEHIKSLVKFKYGVIRPQSKLLACGDEGDGALADIDLIVQRVRAAITWRFPLSECVGIPVHPHPGSFKAVRRDSHIHTGVDLYADNHSTVYACESGKIVSIEPFTGPKDNSPWWQDTDAMLIEGSSGVICYGEITPSPYLTVGSTVLRGQVIGKVKRVILEGKERYEITGWKPSMLHLELYPHGTTKASDGYINVRDFLQNPTEMLLKSDLLYPSDDPIKTITWEPSK